MILTLLQKFQGIRRSRHWMTCRIADPFRPEVDGESCRTQLAASAFRLLIIHPAFQQ
ncbi:MAG: hypothetical protein ACK58L_16085 [Planctomycetota bacterium]